MTSYIFKLAEYENENLTFTSKEINLFIELFILKIREATEISSKKTKIIFNFDKCVISDEFNILEIFKEIGDKTNSNDIYESLNSENSNYTISFQFNKTIFEKNARFDEISCEELSFYNTSFKKGALLRRISVKRLIFRPWELGADVTFGNGGYADIERNKLSTDSKGSIDYFKFRHNYEGNGWIYFIGVKFNDKANFTNTVLNKVHFSNMDMSKCYFFNAIIQDTRFLNCDFPKNKDLWIGTIWKKRFNLFSPFVVSLIGTIIILSLFIMNICMIYVFKENNEPYLLNFLLTISLLFILNTPFMFLNRLLNPFSKHLSVADEKLVLKETDPDKFAEQISSLSEIYRQLRTNFEKNNNYQAAGEFYFSQKHVELAQFDFEDKTKSATQQLLFGALHWINGFGERWVRSIIWFLLTIVLFAFLFTPDSDYSVTGETPQFLTNSTDFKEETHRKINIYSKEHDNFKLPNNKNILYVVKDNEIIKYAIPLNDDIQTKIIYSFSHLITPFIPDEKKWFEIKTNKAYIIGFMETFLLWLFLIASGVALNNRIKR